jgi:hypothetical protein
VVALLLDDDVEDGVVIIEEVPSPAELVGF